MQDTILKYIDILGRYSFKELPFNDVDALIFSLISYVNLPKKINGITIKEASILINQKFNLKKRDTFIDKTKMLLGLLGAKNRYKDLILEGYTKINTNDEQFGAITIRLDKHSIFISFEGTEDNLVGWEEDFKMCYLYPVLAQESASKYLKKQAKRALNIYIGGHSKGGNLSMAAGISANFLLRLKIKKIYNFDGPGFLSNVVNSKKFKRIQKKIITYIPEESIVGKLLDNPSKTRVIKSYARKSMSHDAFTWQCFGSIFVNGNMSDYSYNIDRKVRQIMGKYSTSERKLFVSSFFRILKDSGYTEKSELNKIDFRKASNIIKEMYKLSKEEKKILLDIIKIFLKKETNEE